MKKFLGFIALAFLLLPTMALAQSQRNPCYYTAANPGPGNGCIPVSSANPLPIVGSITPTGTTSVQSAVNVTPTDCSGTVTAGGTAQNAFAASATRHGFTIVNIDTTEPLWISFTGTAAASTSGSYPIAAATATTFASAGSFTSPIGLGMSTALSVVAATTGHKWSCTTW